MTAFEKDRFDAIPDAYPRVGVHRAHPGRLRGAAPVLWSLLATVGLVAVGIVGVETFSARFADTGASQSPDGAVPVEAAIAEVPAQAVFSADEAITVLNGSATQGLATTVGDRLEEGGWTIGTAASAVQDDVATTAVYYADPLDEGAARGVALALGIGLVERSDAFPGSSLTVVIGNDFSG
jgi:hypothetical protein